MEPKQVKPTPERCEVYKVCQLGGVSIGFEFNSQRSFIDLAREGDNVTG